MSGKIKGIILTSLQISHSRT
eukprot:COSAG03_NODE_4462_length_1543_cov_1.572022_1_plen_20_part_10